MTAPIFQSFNALTGDLAASPVPAMLAAADEISGELDRLREENASLKAELEQRVATIEFLALTVYRLRRDNAKLHEVSDGLACQVDRLSDERDEALVRAQELWQTVCDQSAELNQLRGLLASVQAERDTYRLAVSK